MTLRLLSVLCCSPFNQVTKVCRGEEARVQQDRVVTWLVPVTKRVRARYLSKMVHDRTSGGTVEMERKNSFALDVENVTIRLTYVL